MLYAQCTLRRQGLATIENGACCIYEFRTVWLPMRSLAIGARIRLRIRSGGNELWENDWIVQEIGDTLLEWDQIPDAHADVKAHRRATGDAEPKVKTQ